ncbi:MAG: NUDIX hydrolase [Chloroflexi bacterium]|nr:NUDIX hydrolase [Chloroflexota bacterium]
MDNLTEKIVSSEPVYDGKLISLRVDHVELPNGERSMREIVQHPGAVAIVPLLDDDVFLVRQYRLAANTITLEIPAGTLSRGEEPDRAAERELQEEIGYRPGKLTRLGGEYTAPGYTTEYIHLYLAEDLIHSRLAMDDDEFLDIVRLPFSEALRQVEAGEIDDGKTIAALLLVARRLGR